MTAILTPRPGLTAARKRRKLTQAELAHLTGMHRVQLVRYETGQMTPSVDIALRIAKALRTPAEKVWDSSAPGTETGRGVPEETSDENTGERS